MSSTAPRKMPADARAILGCAKAAAGFFVSYSAITALGTMIALGTGGLAVAVMGAGYAVGAATGLWLITKGVKNMAQGFSGSGRTPAEVAFAENPEAFAMKPIQPEFNPKAARDVKVMRPLKLGPRNVAKLDA